MMKKMFLGLMTMVMVAVLSGCETDAIDVNGDNFAAIQERGSITVGMECAYAPFNWTVPGNDAQSEAMPIDDSDQHCDGYDVKTARSIAEALSVDLVVKAINWEALIPSLAQSGEIDMIIAGMSPTADREQTVAFSDEYYDSTHVVVLHGDSEYADATTIDGFSDAEVVGQMGTIYDEVIVQMEGAHHANALEDVPTIVTAIKTGTVDATVLELPVAVAITEANPSLTYIEFTEGNGFDVSYEDRVVSIAVRMDDVTLLGEINAVLATISQETREEWMLDAIDRQPR